MRMAGKGRESLSENWSHWFRGRIQPITRGIEHSKPAGHVAALTGSIRRRKGGYTDVIEYFSSIQLGLPRLVGGMVNGISPGP